MPTRVLVVDDHPMLRRAVRETLEQHFPELEVVGEAADEMAAIALAAELEPAFAIVDLSLEGGHGLELIKRLRQARPELRILVFTMHEERLYARRAFAAGAHGYLNKQATPAEFLAAVRAVLEGEEYSSPHARAPLGTSRTPREPEAPGRERPALSDRELEILELIGRGKTTREIAGRLELSAKTVDAYRQRVKVKLGAKSMAELAQLAVEHVVRTERRR